MAIVEILKIAEQGGFAAVAVIAFAAWFFERKESKRLAQQIIELSINQIVNQKETKDTLHTMKDLIIQFLDAKRGRQ